MSDEKIFKDLEGILDWVKQQTKKDKNNQFQYKSQADKNRKYLEEFLKFLNFHFETDEEFDALIEVLGENFQKRDIQFDDLYDVFVPNKKAKIDQKDELMQAFENLKKADNKEDFIQVDRLQEMLKIFDKKYAGYLPTLMKEIESSDFYDEENQIFEYKKFLENHFKV